MDFGKGELYLKKILVLLGAPESSFDYADPLAVLVVYIFSTEITVLILSVVIWSLVWFIKVGVVKKPKHSKSGRLEDLGITTHEYNNMDQMHKLYTIDKKPSALSVMTRGFVFPVFVIFAALMIAREMAYG